MSRKIRAGDKHYTFVESKMAIWSIESRGIDSATVEILKLANYLDQYHIPTLTVC